MLPLCDRFFAHSSTAQRYASEVFAAHARRSPHLKLLLAKNTHFYPQVSLGLRLCGHSVHHAEVSSQRLADYDLVLPYTLNDIEALRPHAQALENSLVPLPDAAAVALCNDKAALDQQLTERGFGDHIPSIQTKTAEPFLIKKRISAYSQDIHTVLEGATDEASQHLLEDPAYYCQRYIAGKSEHALHAIMRGGQLAAWINIAYHYDTEYPIKGITQVRYNRIEDCQPIRLFESLLQEIGFEGLCCINYKMEGGRPMLLEINPRFGGSLRKFFFILVRQLTSGPLPR